MNLKKKVKFTTAFMAMAVSISTISAPVNAANTTNKNFGLWLVTDRIMSTEQKARLKKNTSSTYVNYKSKVSGESAKGPNKFRAFVYGGTGTTLIDCSSYTLSGKARPKAIVRKGTKGYILQTVYEKFKGNSKIYAELRGINIGNDYGYAEGCWSPDSVSESGTITYN